MPDTALLRTAYHDFHQQRGAHLVDFAGWEMPLRYGSIHDEHKQVRNGGGLFDVSHMGRIRLAGLHARRLLERTLTRRVGDMKPLSCRYTLMCAADGGTIDDCLVYRFDSDWLLVCNASNREQVLEHLQRESADLKVKIQDETIKTAMVALQGPNVMDLIGRFSKEVPTLGRYRFCIKNLLILKLTISRTGYTGEDGVEVIMPANSAAMAMKLLAGGKGASPPLPPIGLGARDTLRMEAGMPLYGHELDRSTDPISAGLSFAVSLDKGEAENEPTFIGQEALRRIADEGPARRLVGLRLEGPRTARQGMAVKHGDDAIGQVTSGCLSPTLGHPIAMAYVDREHAGTGTTLHVDLGRAAAEAQVVDLPFYRRP